MPNHCGFTQMDQFVLIRVDKDFNCSNIFAHLVKPKRFKENKKKNQSFQKNRLVKKYQSSPWQATKLELRQNILNLNRTHRFKNNSLDTVEK